MVEGIQLLDFIRRNIRSVWALELLLAIRSAPQRFWSLPELVGELRASDTVVLGVLAGFEQGGLIARGAGGTVTFAGGGGCLDQLCDALAEAYRERPFTVINAITCADDQVAGLADAFRLKAPPD